MLKDILGHCDIKKSLICIKKSLPSLILLAGPKGVGKLHTICNFIDELYNGTFLYRIKSHPDILFLNPDKNIFKLELIHRMKDFIGDTPFELDKRYVILKNVHLMNKESANACLKIFEDYPANTHFFLTTENIELVVDTLKSRSLVLDLKPIKNLKKYVPDLSLFEEKILKGCLGVREKFKEFNLEEIHQEVRKLVLNYKSLSYAQILDWYNANDQIELEILNDIFLIVSQDLAEKNINLNISLEFIEYCKKFKDKLKTNINLKNHFKNMLIQNKKRITFYE